MVSQSDEYFDQFKGIAEEIKELREMETLFSIQLGSGVGRTIEQMEESWVKGKLRRGNESI